MNNTKVISHFLSNEKTERRKNFNKLTKDMVMSSMYSGEFFKSRNQSVQKEK